MGNADAYATWVEVDLSAIEHNIRQIGALNRSGVMAVIKANAYGHGAVQVARAALQAGRTMANGSQLGIWLGVARVEEALELRRAGIDTPILLLGFTPPGRIAEAVQNRIAITVWDPEQVKQASAAGQLTGQPAHVHIKVDTGMGRLGVRPEEVVALARLVAGLPGVIFEGLFTHFARADEIDLAPTESQEREFRQVLAGLEAAAHKPLLVHAANSAASLVRPSACFNLVRPGIAIYGLHPSMACPLPGSFRPALAWKSVLSQVKMLPSGRGVSYGHEYNTSAVERVGTVPVGYADGFRRIRGNAVLVGGQRVPVIGRVCMDQVMVQLDAVPEAQVGDEVVLIGRQINASITAEQVAMTWGTINYEVVCGIGNRVPRIYP